MADYSSLKPTVGLKDYATKIDTFISAVETDVTGLENAKYAPVPNSIPENNVPMIDAVGNLVDSTRAANSIPQQGTLVSGNYLMSDSNGKIVDSGVPVAISQTYWESTPTVYMFTYSATIGKHTLGTVPKSYSLWMQCLVDDISWSAGDRLGIQNSGIQVVLTNTTVRFYYPTDIIILPDKVQGNRLKKEVTEGRWGIIIGVSK